MEKTLGKILQNDRFWRSLKEIVKVFEPCLYILRLSDKQTPAMDQLYFYVRKMDAIIGRLKEVLNTAENSFSKEVGVNFQSKMMNYFMISKEKNSLTSCLNYEAGDENESDEEVDGNNTDLVDDMESGSDTDDPDAKQDDRCGTVLERIWEKRLKALKTDIAIAGWMCSPIKEIMIDCNKNHGGEHRQAVTRLLQDGIFMRYVWLLCIIKN